MKRLVVKIGSNILTENNGKLDLNNLKQLVDQLAKIHKSGTEVIVVTSGSIVCGSEKIGIEAKTIPQKQAAAAIGQSLLMNEYNRLFYSYGITIAQLLLTHDGLNHEDRYLNAKNTIITLLEENVIPIINENDSVVIDEIKFGDNDNLSVHVAQLINAESLLILTDIDGLYDDDPNKNKNANLISVVEDVTEELLQKCGDSVSGKGTGGMYSKVKATKAALESGIHVVIANGKKDNVILDVLDGKHVGTNFGGEL
jgi:glutamate 5-kinase